MQSRLRRQHLTSRKRHVAQLCLDATVACWEVVVPRGDRSGIYLSIYLSRATILLLRSRVALESQPYFNGTP